MTVDLYDALVGTKRYTLGTHDTTYVLKSEKAINSDYNYIIGIDGRSRMTLLDDMKYKAKEFNLDIIPTGIIHDASPSIPNGLKLDGNDILNVNLSASLGGPNISIGRSFTWQGYPGTKVLADWDKRGDFNLFYTNNGGIAAGRFDNTYALILLKDENAISERVKYEIGYGSNDGRRPDSWKNMSAYTIRWRY